MGQNRATASSNIKRQPPRICRDRFTIFQVYGDFRSRCHSLRSSCWRTEQEAPLKRSAQVQCKNFFLVLQLYCTCADRLTQRNRASLRPAILCNICWMTFVFVELRSKSSKVILSPKFASDDYTLHREPDTRRYPDPQHLW